jgi:hypothetical protein
LNTFGNFIRTTYLEQQLIKFAAQTQLKDIMKSAPCDKPCTFFEENR